MRRRDRKFDGRMQRRWKKAKHREMQTMLDRLQQTITPIVTKKIDKKQTKHRRSEKKNRTKEKEKRVDIWYRKRSGYALNL
jgi:hypothetical protein